MVRAARGEARGYQGGSDCGVRLHLGVISRSPRAGHRRNSPVTRAWWDLESVFGADLSATRIAYHAARVALSWRLVPDIKTPEVLVIKDVEQVHGHSDLRAREPRKILAELQVHPPIGPGVRNDEAVVRRREPTVDVSGRTAEAGWTPDVQVRAIPQRDQPSELNPEREGHVHDPVGHDMVPLIVTALVRVLRDAECVREGARK